MPPKPPSIALAALRAGAKKPQPHPTHFTATGPHASTQPPPRITTIDVPAGAANETPRQKVARLREAARVARIRDLPWHDKLVETTRVWADVTHRWFIVFIMIISGVLGFLTIYTTYDIISFNRIKRRKILELVSKRRSEILRDALRAEGEGRASQKQLQFIERYKAVAQAEEERIASRNILMKAFDAFEPGGMTRQVEAITLAKLDEEMFEKMRQEDIDEAERAEAAQKADMSKPQASNASTKSWARWLGWT